MKKKDWINILNKKLKIGMQVYNYIKINKKVE